jgi:hypothetical protein
MIFGDLPDGAAFWFRFDGSRAGGETPLLKLRVVSAEDPGDELVAYADLSVGLAWIALPHELTLETERAQTFGYFTPVPASKADA